MDFYEEDLGRVAFIRVTKNEVEFRGIKPQRIENADITIVGNAKIVVAHGDKFAMGDERILEAVKDAWVLVVNENANEKLVKSAHPYITIINGSAMIDEAVSETYAMHSRGWNVENADGTHSHKKVLTVGKDECIEVLFGESRENPVGLLSIKCLNK